MCIIPKEVQFERLTRKLEEEREILARQNDQVSKQSLVMSVWADT